MAHLSKRAFEGYLLIDHRDSPGTTVENCLANGVDPNASPLVPKGQQYESATISCTHCQRIVILNPLRTRERHYCGYCDHYICDNPHCRLMASGVVPHKTMQQVFAELETHLLKGID
jgi:hypothetical protein